MKTLHEIAEQIVELVYANYVAGRGCELDWRATDKVEEILKKLVEEERQAMIDEGYRK